MKGVSIIICCYNSSTRIIPTLQHLQKQVFTNEDLKWEVIIVDNASTDDTSENAKKVWSKNPVTEFFVVQEPNPGLTHARHKGLQVAQYEIVSFIDDDNWVEAAWIQKVADIFAMNEKIGACGGRSDAVFEDTAPEWFPLFENSFAVGTQGERDGIINDKKGFLWGAGLSFRKSIWLELQKLHFKNLTVDRLGTTLSAGGDTELCYAFRLMDYQLYYCDDLSLKHYMPKSRMNFSYLQRMIEGFGKANVHLNCYRVLLYPNSFKLHPWWYELMIARKSIFKNFFISHFARNKTNRWQAKVRKSYWEGYASQTWNDKSLLKQHVASLKGIFAAP